MDYSPGQFAFLTFAHSKESHPFTIASYAIEKNTLRFAIKNLGDYTSTLASSIKIGQSALVEGPWGKFDFTLPCSRQVWIAGGSALPPLSPSRVSEPAWRVPCSCGSLVLRQPKRGCMVC
ncbi:FAD-binding oxidoreductase [Escherichia coli]